MDWIALTLLAQIAGFVVLIPLLAYLSIANHRDMRGR